MYVELSVEDVASALCPKRVYTHVDTARGKEEEN